MGKSYKGSERQHNKYSQRDMSRKLKEQEMIATFKTDEAPRPKPKKKWKPHSEIDND